MRLDHLLSKEHLELFGAPRATTRANVSGWSAHGWNIDIGLEQTFLPLSTFFGTGTDVVGMPETCTLLGPEGPGRLRKRKRCGAERLLWTSIRLTRCQDDGVPPVF